MRRTQIPDDRYPRRINAIQNATLSIGGGSLIFNSAGTSDAFNVGALGGSVAVALADNATTPNPVALTAGSNNASTSYTGACESVGEYAHPTNLVRNPT